MDSNNFSGSTRDCFNNLIMSLTTVSPKKSEAFSEVFIKIMGASPEACRSWAKGDSLPKGFELFKLTCFLQYLGYNIPDFINLSSNIKTLGRALVWSLLSVREVVEYMKLYDNAELYRMLNNTRPPSQERSTQIDSFLKEKNISESPPVPNDWLQIKEIIDGSVIDSHNTDEDNGNKVVNLPNPSTEMLRIINSLIAIKSLTNVVKLELDEVITKNNPNQIAEIKNNFSESWLFSLSNDIHNLSRKIGALCSNKAMELYKQKKES